MPIDEAPLQERPAASEAAAMARQLMRTARKGALATIDRESGHPYASLVLTATEPDGTPILLISQLALHTRNLRNNARASLLLDATNTLADPLTGGRVTIMGEARPSDSPTALRRFLTRHPSARGYAGFSDFAVYTLAVNGGHFIGGFGSIFTLTADSLLTSVADAQALIDAEPDVIEHMNTDHAGAVALYATELAHFPPGAWRMSGIDPEGMDLLQCTNAARIIFPDLVRSPAEARAALVTLAQTARSRRAART